MEEWIDIEGFEGLYQISNLGRVKSLYARKEKFLTIRIRNKKGKNKYLSTKLIKNKEEKNFFIHRLIAQAFIPNPENKPQVNHKNGIKTDNRVENLEWNTSQENIQHSFDNGLNKGEYIQGEKHGLSKLTETQIIDIRKRKNYGHGFKTSLAKEFSISESAIRKILKKERWNHI